MIRGASPMTFFNFGIWLDRQFAVLAEQHTFRFLGRHLVTFAADDVKHRLRADDLAGRRYERRITEVRSHSGNFFQNFKQSVLCALLFELAYEVAEHTARHLINKRVDVNFQYFRA